MLFRSRARAVHPKRADGAPRWGAGLRSRRCLLYTSRALRYAREHRIERMEKIVAQMDAHNEALRRQGVQKVMDENEGRLREIADYARRSVTQEYVPGDAFTTRFV